MTSGDVALMLRSAILAEFMIAAALAVINALEYRRKHTSAQDRERRSLAALKAVAVLTYGGGAFYGTFARFDAEFTWSLPPMALGLCMYIVYLWKHGDDCGPKASAGTTGDRELERLVG